MATRFRIHPENPQPRQIATIVEQLRRGAVMLYPTDTVYALGCDLFHRDGQERIRLLRRLPEDKPLTFVASSLSDMADYAHISDTAYHILRRLVPGPYTFLLPASKQVPKLVLNPRRKTTGIRVPHHEICQTLIRELGNPLISMSARLPDRDEPGTSDELFDQFEPHVDIIIDDESEYHSSYAGPVSTMIDLTDEIPRIVREGLGLELALQYV
jgi:tRNA threonylcarbamoyl adenosine modification protein (Sua5/YciO/YrdC/YwlC family)